MNKKIPFPDHTYFQENLGNVEVLFPAALTVTKFPKANVWYYCEYDDYLRPQSN